MRTGKRVSFGPPALSMAAATCAPSAAVSAAIVVAAGHAPSLACSAVQRTCTVTGSFVQLPAVYGAPLAVVAVTAVRAYDCTKDRSVPTYNTPSAMAGDAGVS